MRDQHEPADDGYDGPAELLDGERAIPVTVTLRGQFDPISGSYRWYGRVAASAAVTAWIAEGVRAVTLRTPFAAVETTLSDVDPWGRPRVRGFGAAPFAVADEPAPAADWPRRPAGRHYRYRSPHAGECLVRWAGISADRALPGESREDS